MSNFGKRIAGVAVVLLVIVLGFFAFKTPSSTNYEHVGSVTVGGEYQGTTTSVAGFAGLQVSLVSNKAGTLGSVVVSSTTPATPTTGTLRIMNATSTTDISSTTIASFPIQPTQGTYTFDIFAPRGIIVEAGAGFNGTYTITSRQN